MFVCMYACMYAYLLYFAEMHVKQGIFELAPAVEREIESDILHNLQLGDHAICMYVCLYMYIYGYKHTILSLRVNIILMYHYC